MDKAELATYTYVSQYLPDELQLMQTGGYATAHPELTPQEKALLYHYTYTGSQSLNVPMYHNGGVLTTPFGLGMAAALRKLPLYSGVVHSAAQWEVAELRALQLRVAVGQVAISLGVKRWPAFLSASRSRAVAKQHLNYSPKNCLLSIFSKTGRLIESLSHYGPNGPDSAANEQEVLFLPAALFRVVAVRQTTSFTEIELLEP